MSRFRIEEAYGAVARSRRHERAVGGKAARVDVALVSRNDAERRE